MDLLQFTSIYYLCSLRPHSFQGALPPLFVADATTPAAPGLAVLLRKTRPPLYR